MSVFSEYDQYDGLGLAALVSARQITPGELVEEAINRIESDNTRLNAVVYKMYEHARAAAMAALPSGPFSGVPFLLKDLISRYAGVPTSCGNRLLRDIPASSDSELVRRFKAAGVITVGKTNTPEFGLTPYTESTVLGPARNPWDCGRTAGGSSGGSASAVAIGFVPLASGGDGGGSIRIPASCCGLFGLKPTRGRTPTGPHAGELWRGFAIEHVITRSVRDSAAMLDATAGADIGAPYSAPAPTRRLLDEVSAAPQPLRIAFTAHPFFGTFLEKSVKDDCIRGLRATVDLLRQLGHETIEAAPALEGDRCAVAFLTIVAAEARADVEWAAAAAGRRVSWEDFDPDTYALGLVGKALSASEYASASRLLQATARDVGRFFEQYDVLLTPTMAQLPPEIGALKPRGHELALLRLAGRLDAAWLLRALGIINTIAARIFAFTPYTPLFNVSGQPAMSVPLWWNDAGLPIGMQFVGRFGDEATLFRLAGQLERAQPWFHRRPAITPAPRALGSGAR
jgi:amidase